MTFVPQGNTTNHVDWQREITIECGDGHAVVVRRNCLMQSHMLREIVCSSPPGEPLALTLSDVSSVTMLKVYLWLEHYETQDPLPLATSLRGHLQDGVPQWDFDVYYSTVLCKEGNERCNDAVFLVLNAAEYLGIKALHDFCCLCVAHLLQEKNETKFYETFGITQHFTDSERARVATEYPWLLEGGKQYNE